MILRGITVLCLLVSQLVAWGQKDTSEELRKLKTESEVGRKTQTERVREYAEKNNVPLSYRDYKGVLVVLVGVSDSGVPLYKAVDNAGAAITTGVPSLRAGGSLGLNLEGDGMVVGVWDEGLVQHDEYDGRLLSQQGAASVHSNHVTGTILATGINPLAKGMAPKAKAYTFDFNDDESEMLSLAKPDQTGLLMSNHSYGLITGWRFNNGWTWFGDPSISIQEDYRFGFYSANAAFWDQIAFNAPYYTIMKSAGNDRAEVGNGSRPADCNGGSGYDCISDVSAAKNIITVGAVAKVLNYVDASSVQMSSFSSWGPTDDGRIKPDLVAAGVGLISTSTNNEYTSLNGTSMATPNATGSLLLIQELYKNLNGEFMTATALKALAIHTTKEAGVYAGPDYRFGWGLLDVEKAGKVVLERNGSSVAIGDHTLTQGQTFEIILNPKQGEKITATIVWADPAGTPVAPALDPVNRMLVNDLDLRIVDDGGNVQMPWILDPANPDTEATRGDNIRDNVEKLEFDNPSPRSYKLQVRHKGNLAAGSQKFSLVLTYTALNETQTPIYWVGGTGNWNSTAHWSLTSGGASAGSIPTADSKVVIDENSFPTGGTLSLTANTTIGSLVWLNRSVAGIALGSNTLTIRGNLTLAAQEGSITATTGKLVMTGELFDESTILSNDNNLSGSSLEINGDSKFVFSGEINLKSIHLISGELSLNDSRIVSGELVVDNNASGPNKLDITDLQLTGVSNLVVQAGTTQITSSGALIELTEDAVFDFGNKTYSGTLLAEEGNVEVKGNNTIDELIVGNDILLSGSNTISSLIVQEGTDILLAAGTIQTLSQNTTLNSSAANRISITGQSGDATIHFDGRYKLCFNFLNVTNVDLTGEAIVTAGANSTLAGSQNWSLESCEDILFPDFDFDGGCAQGLVTLTDKSGGDITTWQWTTNAPNATISNASSSSPKIIFPAAGQFNITLTLSNGTINRAFTRQITIQPNDLPSNTAVINGLNLFSLNLATGYQWYKDFELVPAAVARTFSYGGTPGTYFVTTKSGSCNRVSDFVVITSVNESVDGISIYPNPAAEKFMIEGIRSQSKVKLVNSNGQTMMQQDVSVDTWIDTKDWTRGLYVIVITQENRIVTHKILLR